MYWGRTGGGHIQMPRLLAQHYMKCFVNNRNVDKLITQIAHSVCVCFRIEPMKSDIDLWKKRKLFISLAEVVHCLHVVEYDRYRYGGIDRYQALYGCRGA